MQRHDSFSRLYYIMQIISPYGSQLCTIQGLYIICHNNRNVELSDTLIKVLHDLQKTKKKQKKEQHWKSITFNFAPLTAPFICLAQVSCLHAISTCNEEINSNCGIIIFRWSPPWLVMQFIKAQLYHQLIIIGHYIHSHAAHVNQQTAKCINIA